MADTTTKVASGTARGPFRRSSSFLNAHPRTRLGATLGIPLLWIGVIYLGALVLLFLNAFWRVDVLTGKIVQDWGLRNFDTLWSTSVYRTISIRTVRIAALVTIADIVLAFPLAYYAARIATPRVRALLLVAVVLPLWSSYLVKAFAWQTITAPHGILDSFLGLLRIPEANIGASEWAIWLTFTYLWLPFVILPIYASLERIPESYLEAAGDLGARGWKTFRHVVWPMAIPGVVAGSIFSFSLTLGDYIAPSIVGNTKFIGNVIYDNVGVANNLPLAAAFALVPVAIMAIYLALAKRIGAFEAL
ncbi:MAG TPA: ABC transporter permease [Actinomycetota bacterium]|nr:ABC transporter permease [Actinomycetota bacterium]